IPASPRTTSTALVPARARSSSRSTAARSPRRSSSPVPGSPLDTPMVDGPAAPLASLADLRSVGHRRPDDRHGLLATQRRTPGVAPRVTPRVRPGCFPGTRRADQRDRGCIGAYQTPPQRKDTTMGKTTDIREAVEAELEFDPLVHPSDITVKNITGQVALNGTVPSYPQYLEAAAAAQRVAGVTDVHNHLEVLLPDVDYR